MWYGVSVLSGFFLDGVLVGTADGGANLVAVFLSSSFLCLSSLLETRSSLSVPLSISSCSGDFGDVWEAGSPFSFLVSPSSGNLSMPEVILLPPVDAGDRFFCGIILEPGVSCVGGGKRTGDFVTESLEGPDTEAGSAGSTGDSWRIPQMVRDFFNMRESLTSLESALLLDPAVTSAVSVVMSGSIVDVSLE